MPQDHDPTASEGWFVLTGGGQRGPYSARRLAALAASGRLGPEDLVWRPGFPDWRPLREVAGLLGGISGRAPAAASTGQVPPGSHRSRRRADRPAAPPGRRHRGYLARHWHGELPLAIAYWVNGGVIGLVVGAVIFGIGLAAGGAADPMTAALTMAGSWLLVASITLWQSVGIWRSAGQHAVAGRRRLWSRLARISAVLGVVQFVLAFTGQGVPAFAELAKAAFFVDPRAHALRLEEGGRVVAFSGRIDFGLDRELRAMLDAHPGVVLVALDSPGGRVGAARAVRDLIRERALDTYAPRFCASACTTMFLGGSRRFVAPGARLGFHRPTAPGATRLQIEVLLIADRRDMHRLGIPQSFTDRAFSTPNETMLFPTLDELRVARVITGTAPGLEAALRKALSNRPAGTGAGGVASEPAPTEPAPAPEAASAAVEPPRAPVRGERAPRAEVERQLLASRLFRTIREADPDTYRKARDAIASGIADGRPAREAAAAGMAVVLPLFYRSLPRTGDAELWSAAAFVAEELGYLGGRDDDACYAFAFGRGGIARGLPDDMRERAGDILADVIGRAAVDPVPVPDAETVAPAMQALARRLKARLGGDFAVALRPDRARADHARACRAATAFYRELLSMPRGDAVPLLRRFFADAAKG